MAARGEPSGPVEEEDVEVQQLPLTDCGEICGLIKDDGVICKANSPLVELIGVMGNDETLAVLVEPDSDEEDGAPVLLDPKTSSKSFGLVD